MQLHADQLEQELKRVNEEATAEKKRLKEGLKEEQRKNRDADELLTSVSAGKANHPRPCVCRTESLYLTIFSCHRFS
jgi:hypothetical protein